MAQTNSSRATTQLEVHHDIACPGCGCLCDDLKLTLAGNQLSGIEPHCALAETYFHESTVSLADCRIDGQPASLDEALSAAAKILQNAKSPLFFGLGEMTSETVRKIVDLADRAGGILDGSHPTFFDPTGRIVQTTGMVTCTLGEIRHRSDLVIFWGCDPKKTHPRHWERYSVEPKGRFVSHGRQDRHVVGMGSPNATTESCDAFIALEPDQQIAALHALVSLSQGKPQNDAALAAQLKEAASALADLHQRITASKYFVFVLGDGFLRREVGRVPLELLAQYVRPMHEKTRGAVSLLRPGPNWLGAGGVVASRTGYPGGASLTQGLSRFDPDNGSAVNLLAQKRVDACFLLEGPWLNDLPSDTTATLETTPSVILGHRPSSKTIQRGVFIPIARPGFSDRGTMSRLDDMPLPLRNVASSEVPAAEEVVQGILKKLTG